MLTKIDFVVKKKKHITIKYAFHLAVRNVERQIVTRFVTGVQMFQPINNQSCLKLLSFVIMDFALLDHSNFPQGVLFICVGINYLRCAMLPDCTVHEPEEKIRCVFDDN